MDVPLAPGFFFGVSLAFNDNCAFKGELASKGALKT